ncbi:MAG: type II toxin-antitoxin system RelE/ParE family toxin [Gemmatimonadota bacterium]
MTRYDVHPLAEAEIDAATGYYSERSRTVSRAFIAEFEHLVNVIRRHPQIGTLIGPHTRRVTMRHFPYNIIYVEIGNRGGIHLLAVAHNRQRPGYWASRISETRG